MSRNTPHMVRYWAKESVSGAQGKEREQLEESDEEILTRKTEEKESV